MQLLKAIKVLFSEAETEDQRIEKEYRDFNIHWPSFQYDVCTEIPKTRSKWLPVLFMLTKRFDENFDEYQYWFAIHHRDLLADYIRCVIEIRKLELLDKNMNQAEGDEDAD